MVEQYTIYTSKQDRYEFQTPYQNFIVINDYPPMSEDEPETPPEPEILDRELNYSETIETSTLSTGYYNLNYNNVTKLTIKINGSYIEENDYYYYVYGRFNETPIQCELINEDQTILNYGSYIALYYKNDKTYPFFITSFTLRNSTNKTNLRIPTITEGYTLKLYYTTYTPFIKFTNNDITKTYETESSVELIPQLELQETDISSVYWYYLTNPIISLGPTDTTKPSENEEPISPEPEPSGPIIPEIWQNTTISNGTNYFGNTSISIELYLYETNSRIVLKNVMPNNILTHWKPYNTLISSSELKLIFFCVNNKTSPIYLIAYDTINNIISNMITTTDDIFYIDITGIGNNLIYFTNSGYDQRVLQISRNLQTNDNPLYYKLNSIPPIIWGDTVNTAADLFDVTIIVNDDQIQSPTITGTTTTSESGSAITLTTNTLNNNLNYVFQNIGNTYYDISQPITVTLNGNTIFNFTGQV